MLTPAPKIATYWDFENLHASLYEQFSTEEYKPYQIQRERLLDITALMDYIYSLGDVVINRAYNDWQFYRVYKNELLLHAIDLIQLYPKGAYAKNGADIRLAMDALEDAYQNPHITHVVIIGGDSDYIAVAQKLKKLGKFVIGIGVQGTTNPFWTRSCNQFKYYETLTRKVQPEQTPLTAAPDYVAPPPASSLDFNAARDLLVKAVRRLLTENDVEAILKAKVRPMMTRLDPGFDSANYGFQTFNAFVAACSDVIRSFKGEYDVMIALRTPHEEVAVTTPEPVVHVEPSLAHEVPSTSERKTALDLFLWAVQINQLNDTIKITLSDIGMTFKLLAPGFNIHTCGYPKNNGFKVLAEDVAGHGFITLTYDQELNVHYVTPTERFAAQISQLTAPSDLRHARCLRVMSKLYLFFRPDDILAVYNLTLTILEEAQCKGATLTPAQLLEEALRDPHTVGQHLKRLQQILQHLIKLGFYRDALGAPLMLEQPQAIAKLDPADELMSRYLVFVREQIISFTGEEYTVAFLNAIFAEPPHTDAPTEALGSAPTS